MRRFIVSVCLLALVVPLAHAGGKTPAPLKLGVPRKTDDAVAKTQVYSCAFSPDGKHLAWVHFDPCEKPGAEGGMVILVWDIETKKEIREVRTAEEANYATSPIRFNATGKWLVFGCVAVKPSKNDPGAVFVRYYDVRVLLISSGKELPYLRDAARLLKSPWTSVSLTKEGPTATAVSAEGGKAWLVLDNKVTNEIDAAGTMTCVSPDGKRIAGQSGEKDKLTHVWGADGKEHFNLGQSGPPIEFSADGKYLATAGADGVLVYELEKGTKLHVVPMKLDDRAARNGRVVFAADGQRMAWNNAGKISIADTVSGKVLMTLDGPAGALAFSPNGSRLAVAAVDGVAWIWDVK